MRGIQIKSMRDIAKLTPEEFERLLPDLAAWHEIAHAAESSGIAYSEGFEWIDDDRPGAVDHVDLTIGNVTKRFRVESPEGSE